MSKLFKLKEWLTVADAAKYLATAFDEPVSEADVLRLALDRRLVLSVDFVNHTRGRPGRISYYTHSELLALFEAGTYPEDLKWFHQSPSEVREMRALGFTHLPEAAEKKGISTLMSQRLDDERLLTLSDRVETISGVCDLLMVGAESLDVEHLYQQLTGGPAVTLTTLDGALVQDRNGCIYNLLEDYEDNEYCSGSLASLAQIERRIIEADIRPEKASELREAHATARLKFKERRKTNRPIDNHYPANGLPEDAVLVVRTSALSRFLDDVSGRATEKAVTTKERTSLLCIIAALCESARIDYRKASKSAGIIREIAHDELGIAIGETTVENYLKQIPDALETRTK